MAYEAKWKHYRFARLRALAGLVIAVALFWAPLGIDHLRMALTHKDPVKQAPFDLLVMLAILASLILLLATWLPFLGWLCPRCRKSFFGLNPFAKKCRKCGLPKYATEG